MGSVKMLDFKYVTPKMMAVGLAYFIFINGLSIVNASKGMSNSLFDYVINMRGGGSADILTLVLGVLPLFSLIIPLLMDQTERSAVVLRVRRKRRLYMSHVFFAAMVSALLTATMALTGLFASWIETGHVHNLWGSEKGTIYFLLDDKNVFPLYIPHVTSVKVWAYILSSRFLALLFIAVFVIFLKASIKKNVYVFFTSLILLGTDGLFSERWSLFLGKAQIKLETWLAPTEQIFNLTYFLLGIAVMFFIGAKIYDRKEFYQ